MLILLSGSHLFSRALIKPKIPNKIQTAPAAIKRYADVSSLLNASPSSDTAGMLRSGLHLPMPNSTSSFFRTLFQNRPASWASRLQQAHCKRGTVFRAPRSRKPAWLATVGLDAPHKPSRNLCTAGRSFEKPGKSVIGAQTESADPCYCEQAPTRYERRWNYGSNPVRMLDGGLNFESRPHDFPLFEHSVRQGELRLRRSVPILSVP